MRKTVATLACAPLLACAFVLAGARAGAQDLTAEAKRLMERADLKRAFDHVDAHKDEILEEWKTITEINAPSGKERERAQFIKRLLDSCKLDKVYTDAKGNLIAI